MEQEHFCISEEELTRLKGLCPNMGKNSDVGKFAVEVAKAYLKQKFRNIDFSSSKYVDLCAEIGDQIYEYEIKGTTDSEIAWNKLKVSSKNCYNKLVNGMPLLRITNIGKQDMIIYTLIFGEDFDLQPEDRWAVFPIKKPTDEKYTTKNPSINEVRDYIKKRLECAKEMGFKELILQSGDIHSDLMMYQALPTVCNAMKTLGDRYPYEIISQPLKGLGARLFVKYKL